MASPAWDRLIRYVSARDGAIRLGDPIVTDAHPDIDALAQSGSLRVRVLEGRTPLAAAPTGDEDSVQTLLGPLTPADVPIIRCVGLNYKTHNTRSPVPVPALSHSSLDFEGELVVVIGRDAKNVSPTSALDHVAAYTVGNDVSCRAWQFEAGKAGAPQPQWCFSKSFDSYAPLGPALVSAKLLPDGAKGLRLTTKVNGDLRQDASTADLCFGVKELVSFLSTGQTLLAGSVIMTGTPGGVGFAEKPPRFLKDGDEVQVEIEGLGKLVNRMKFE